MGAEERETGLGCGDRTAEGKAIPACVSWFWLSRKFQFEPLHTERSLLWHPNLN